MVFVKKVANGLLHKKGNLKKIRVKSWPQWFSQWALGRYI